MKIKEILNEGGQGSLSLAAAKALPSTIVLPNLPNEDAYLQYRMGLALAAARSGIDPKDFYSKNAFGENMAIIGYTDADRETVELAIKLMGDGYGENAHMISTRESEEADDVNSKSPVAKRKKNRYGV